MAIALLLAHAAFAQCPQQWGDYSIMDETGTCASGTAILEYDACTAAHAAYTEACPDVLTGMGGKETWDGPAGCHAQERGGYLHFQFNENLAGTRAEAHRPICVGAEAGIWDGALAVASGPCAASACEGFTAEAVVDPEDGTTCGQAKDGMDMDANACAAHGGIVAAMCGCAAGTACAAIACEGFTAEAVVDPEDGTTCGQAKYGMDMDANACAEYGSMAAARCCGEPDADFCSFLGCPCTTSCSAPPTDCKAMAAMLATGCAKSCNAGQAASLYASLKEASALPMLEAIGVEVLATCSPPASPKDSLAALAAVAVLLWA